MSEETSIPRTMSTQHPDNASPPEWAGGGVVEGEAELREVHFAYQALGCDEVMWDSEGKDVDTHVVRKLLSKYPDFFRERVLGEDVFLTYRVPNPQIEIAERKIVTETLQVVPLSSDVASVFYRRRTTPIFEVILPFTTSGRQLVWLHDYYRKVIAGAENIRLEGSMKVSDWVGAVNPKAVRVIPLVEDFESLLGIDRVVEEYVGFAKPDHLRVFIARSDPALNYGLITAVLLSKIALSRLYFFQRRRGVKVNPIIGVGSMPFRGNLSPESVGGFLDEYRGLATVTTQSAFRYDFPQPEVKRAVRALNRGLPNGDPRIIEPDDERALHSAMEKLIAKYQTRIEELAPLINGVASFVPQRRARKLHIGLFGYSRSVRGIAMPRAIPFAAAFYSMGIPPEFIGAEALRDLTENEWDLVRSNYLSMKGDLAAVGRYVSWSCVNMLMEMHPAFAKRSGTAREHLKTALAQFMADLAAVEELLSIRLGPGDNSSRRHENFVNNFLISYAEGDDAEARTAFMQAARLRRCLG